MEQGYAAQTGLTKIPLPLQWELWLETISKKRGLGSKTVIGLLSICCFWMGQSEVRAKIQPALWSPRHGGADEVSWRNEAETQT